MSDELELDRLTLLCQNITEIDKQGRKAKRALTPAEQSCMGLTGVLAAE